MEVLICSKIKVKTEVTASAIASGAGVKPAGAHLKAWECGNFIASQCDWVAWFSCSTVSRYIQVQTKKSTMKYLSFTEVKGAVLVVLGERTEIIYEQERAGNEGCFFRYHQSCFELVNQIEICEVSGTSK